MYFGAPGGIRTHDLPVRSRALYPLSYGRLFRAQLYYHIVFLLSRLYGKIFVIKIYIKIRFKDC